MPLFSLLDTDRGTDAGGEWRLIVRNEQPLENIQISRHRVGVDILVINRLDVFR